MHIPGAALAQVRLLLLLLLLLLTSTQQSAVNDRALAHSACGKSAHVSVAPCWLLPQFAAR
jgi:hypothetical protein